MPDAFSHDELYDHDIIREAHQIGIAMDEAVNGVPRFEASVLIALAKLFVDVCDGADLDPETAFSQIAEGVNEGAFEPDITGYVHDGHSTLN